MTKLKSQYKPTQLTLTPIAIDPKSNKDPDNKNNAGKQQTGFIVEPKPHQMMTCMFFTFNKHFKRCFFRSTFFLNDFIFDFIKTAITNIGGDVMRSKTAEFERMLTQQQQTKPISRSQSQNQSQYQSSSTRTGESKSSSASKSTKICKFN